MTQTIQPTTDPTATTRPRRYRAVSAGGDQHRNVYRSAVTETAQATIAVGDSAAPKTSYFDPALILSVEPDGSFRLVHVARGDIAGTTIAAGHVDDMPPANLAEEITVANAAANVANEKLGRLLLAQIAASVRAVFPDAVSVTVSDISGRLDTIEGAPTVLPGGVVTSRDLYWSSASSAPGTFPAAVLVADAIEMVLTRTPELADPDGAVTTRIMLPAAG